MIDDPHHAEGPGARVLLVDDDTDTCRAYARLLQSLGCMVETAADGGAAIEILRVGSFDLVVSDISMPGLSGTQFLRAVREQGLDVPVILMTGAPGLETAVEAVDYRASYYLTKPVDLDTLAQAVRSAIHAHVAKRALAEHAPLLEACRRIMRATVQEPAWDFAAIWMLSGEQRLRCTETWARPGCDAAAFENTTRTTEFEFGRGLPGRVWVSGSPEWIPDLALDPNFLRAGFAANARLRSGFAVPLGAEGEVFAVIEFFGRKQCGPDLALLGLLATSCAQLGAQVLRERAEQRAAGAETARRSIGNALDAIMKCAPAFMIAVDEAGRIQFINRVLPHHKGEDVIGSDWLQYMPSAEHERHRARLRRVVETGAFEIYETTVAGPDGEKLWFSTHMGPMREGDRIVGAVLVSQEVTELKRTQAEAASSQRLAAVGTLAAGVAHEINTPVQFVNDSVHFLRDAANDVFGLVGKLQEVRRLVAEGAPAALLQEVIAAAEEAEEEADLAYLNENVPKAFERCVDGLERISTIVRSMKEFAHPAQDEMAPTDLNRAIRNTLTIARSEYKYVAEVEADLGELPQVTCHVNDINQVVLNLVVNAAHAIDDVVKGTDNRGTIRLRTRQDGEHVLISIGDTGAGIPEAIADRIFEPFFTTKEVGKGTGQGLSLAWRVVKEKHGGELSFESTVGQGTTFFIRLPIAGKQRKQASEG